MQRSPQRLLSHLSHTRCEVAEMTSSVFTPCQKPRRELSTHVRAAAPPHHHHHRPLWVFRRLACACRPSLLPLPHLSYLPLGGGSQPTADLVCLSGMNGSTLWSSPLPEEAQDVTCLDLMPGSMAKTICLVTGTRKMLSAFNATSGSVVLSFASASLGFVFEQPAGEVCPRTGWKLLCCSGSEVIIKETR